MDVCLTKLRRCSASPFSKIFVTFDTKNKCNNDLKRKMKQKFAIYSPEQTLPGLSGRFGDLSSKPGLQRQVKDPQY